MKNQKNFYIVRFYLNNECYLAMNISKSDAQDFAEYFEDAQENQAGGMNTWFRVDVSPSRKEYIQAVFKNAESDHNFVLSPIKL
jgi:hypothetical protein